jgi:hypothetical protein
MVGSSLVALHSMLTCKANFSNKDRSLPLGWGPVRTPSLAGSSLVALHLILTCKGKL